VFYFDPLYFVFALPALLLAFFAQWRVRSAYSENSRIPNERGMTGLQVAQQLLTLNGLSHISIEGTAGDLTDHYDPRSKTLRLSPAVAHSASVAALGIVAHEVGHATQDAQNYTPLALRSAIVPAVSIGSYLGPILFFVGILIGFTGLAWLGVAAFAGAVVFAFITLPVEFNASGRAMAMLQTNGLVSRYEYGRAKAVLDAAALTYVAALAQAISNLLYYVFILTRFTSSRDE